MSILKHATFANFREVKHPEAGLIPTLIQISQVFRMKKQKKKKKTPKITS